MAQSLGDIAGCLFVGATLACTLHHFSRKVAIIFFALVSVGYFFVFLTPLPGSSPALALLAFFLVKMLTIIFFIHYSLGYIVAFPKQIENNCLSIVTSMGGVGKILGPLSIRLAYDNNINPFVVFGGGMILLAVLPTSFMDPIK